MARSGKNKDQPPQIDGQSPIKATADDERVENAPEETVELAPSGEEMPISDNFEKSLNEPATNPAKSARPGLVRTSGVLIAGILAASVGFLAAQYAGNDRWPFPPENSVTDGLAQKITGLESMVQEQQAELQQLTLELASKSEPGDLDQLGGQIRETNAVSNAIKADLALLAARLTDVENRPIPEPGADQAAIDFYAQELAAMRAMLGDELANIAARQEAVALESMDAERLAKSNTVQQSISQIQMAAQNGLPFVDQLEQLRSTGTEIDPILGQLAETGIPTIDDLKDEFPLAARQALAASAESPKPDLGAEKGVLAFFRNQLGVRSLEPKSGASVDAVLSRAEAAVSGNDIAAALNELDALSDIAKHEMAIWMKRAKQRLDALQLISALAPPVSE